MSRSSWIHWSLLAVLLFVAGCGDKAKVDTVPATGLVTLDGQPVAGATVSFSPTGRGARAAVGTTDASGRFTLTTVTPNDGAMPGTYAVIITKGAATAGGPPPEDPRASGGKLTPEQMKAAQEAMANAGKKVEMKSDIPEKYGMTASSGFTATVTKGEKNDFTFAMTK